MMNASSTLQYLKKPFFWKLGYLKLNKKAKIQTGGEEAEVNLETCVPLPEEENSAPLSLTAFKGELDSAVTQYLTQVKDLGYKEESRDQKLLEVKFKLDPQEIRPKVKEEIKDTRPRVKVISREDKGEQTELEVELPSLDNPLYLTLSECSSGELPLEHFYENGQITDDEHIYENVENSTGDEDEEHLYDTLPRHKPDLPPKPDFLAQLAARQSEPVKRAWNPFVSLSVETGDPTPPLSTASSLSSPDSHASSDRLEDASPRRSVGSTNPFLASVPRETSEQTLILDGSETSDLGSSGGEEDSGSVEDWPLPPTPPPGEDAVIVEDHPLPPPPPELALQELEEEVIREEEEERKLALQREKEAIEREYGALRFQDPDFREEESDKVEAVNANLALLERNFEDSSDTESTARREPTTEKERKLTLSKETQPEAKKEVKRELKKETEREFKREAKTEVKSSADEKKSKREAKVVPLDGDSEEFDTPAIRHSVIIELKDSCPSVPQSLKPSEIRRKESLKRSESLKRTGILERIETQRKLERRESFCKLFPKLATSLQSRPEDHGSSVSVGVKSPKKEDPAFSFLNVPSSAADQVIEISEDGSWEMKETSMDSDVAAHANPDIDPFTGNPIMAPPLSPAAIAAPPLAFQTDDGMDGVYSANIVSTALRPSSLASASTDSLGTLTSLQADASAQLSTPETILEEILPAPLVESRSEVEARQQLSPKRSQEEPQQQAKNLGAAIMKGYEQDLMKKKESMNLPEHSLLEFGDSVRDLEEQRRSVIKQMTVKAKRKDTWIKTFSMHAHGDESSIPVAPSRCRRKNSPSRDALEAGKVTQFAKKVDEIEKETTVRTPPKTSPKKEDLPKEEPAVPPKAPEKRKKPQEGGHPARAGAHAQRERVRGERHFPEEHGGAGGVLLVPAKAKAQSQRANELAHGLTEEEPSQAGAHRRAGQRRRRTSRPGTSRSSNARSHDILPRRVDCRRRRSHCRSRRGTDRSRRVPRNPPSSGNERRTRGRGTRKGSRRGRRRRLDGQGEERNQQSSLRLPQRGRGARGRGGPGGEGGRGGRQGLHGGRSSGAAEHVGGGGQGQQR
nr:msx2-interacting protein-like [Penaeus vannamei]